MYPIDSYLYDVCPSICKIIYHNKVGTGFFIKLYKNDKPLFSLMTNEYIITKNMIEKKEEIEVYYDNQKKRIKISLNKNERFIQSFIDIDIDCTIVEILNKDNVNEDYFLLPDIDYKDYNYNELKNKNIYIVQFPLGKSMHYSNGEIINIDKYEFSHKASTEPGSSGSPVFLEQTTKVIGIHKASDNYKKENYGDFIFPIINKLNNMSILADNNIFDSKIKEKEEYYSLKYVFIGDYDTGKSNIISVLANQKMRKAIGTDCIYLNEIKKSGNKKFEIQVWDSSGAERYIAINVSHIRGAACAFIVYDIKKISTFENASYWIELIKHANDETTKVLIGNDCNPELERAVSYEEGIQLAKYYRLSFSEVSDKTGLNIDKIFNLSLNVIAKKIDEGYYNLKDKYCCIKEYKKIEEDKGKSQESEKNSECFII